VLIYDTYIEMQIVAVCRWRTVSRQWTRDDGTDNSHWTPIIAAFLLQCFVITYWYISSMIVVKPPFAPASV